MYATTVFAPLPVGALDWRSTAYPEGILQFYAGDVAPSPLIDRYQCRNCHAVYYGTSLLADPPCPGCSDGRLQTTGKWDLEHEAWPWLTQGKPKVDQAKRKRWGVP
jgi:hypothetical protein